MECAKTYVISKLETLIVQIPSLKVLYKYDLLSKEHLIKVYPSDFISNNEEYKDIESEIIFDFIEKYPYESLVFFTENDWIDIDCPDKIFLGKTHQAHNFIINFNSQELFFFQNPEDDLLKIEDGVLNDEYSNINLKNIDRDLPNIKLEGSFYESLIKTRQCILTNNNISNQIEGGLIDCNHNSTEEYCGCNNYALAA